MAIKAVLSAISIFSPRGREKNAPLTDMACWADCADLSKKRPVAVADPQTPTASLRFAFFPLYVSILEDLRSTELRRFCVCVCVCIVAVPLFQSVWEGGPEKADPSPARLLEC